MQPKNFLTFLTKQSHKSMEYLQVLDNKQIASLFHIRESETRIGQTAVSGEDFMESIKSKKNLPKYVIFGIPED
ncbi:MAG: hypothetical protein ACHQF2_07820, partial [Flavobacteriales bacterium]